MSHKRKQAWWMADTVAVQESGRWKDSAQSDAYTDEQVRRAIVYTREDVAGLFCLLDAVNVQLRSITYLLLAILMVAVPVALRYLGILR